MTAATRFAVRPFLGRVNGISGKIYSHEQTNTSQGPVRSTGEQDYIVCTEQPIHLRGIVVRPGVVKQFVATEIAPRSTNAQYQESDSSRAEPATQQAHNEQDSKKKTVEWQMTGMDTFGGVQLQIIPRFDVARMFAGNLQDVCVEEGRVLSYYAPISKNFAQYDPMKTPRELGLTEGHTIHMKDMRYRSHQEDTKVVEDLFREAPTALNFTDQITLHVYPIHRTGYPVRNLNVKTLGTDRTHHIWLYTFDRISVARFLLEEKGELKQRNARLLYHSSTLDESKLWVSLVIQSY